jgi:regulation of enolase protein 1 (concanavalin A-like superfamily)
LEPNSEVTLTVEVQNLTTGSVEGYFDVDLYVDPPSPPVTNRPGTSKQWVLGMGPLETKVITHVVTLYGGGLHELWAQVDTSNWVPDEGDETNNIFGPSAVTAASQECTDADGNVVSDRFSEPGPDPDPKWRPAKIGDASVHETTVIEVDGTLSIEANGSGMWDNPDAGGTFLYQPVAGDFVATLKIIQGMSGGAEGPGEQFAKVGLMARASASASSRWVSVMKARDGVQFGFRTGSRGERFANDAPVGSPVWVRLIRSGDSFAGFYSSDGASWVPGTGNGEDGGVTVDLGDNILIGIAALSSSGNPAIAVVDDFEVCFMDADSETCQDYSDDFEGESTAVWSDVDIGTTQPGSSNIDVGTMTVLGNGASLWESDNLHFTYQQVSGNFVATLKVNSGPGQDEWSKAGLMVRGSPAQDSAQVMVMKTRDYGLQFGYRETDGDPNRRFAADTRSSSMPVWVRIVRSGSGFSAFHSTDGANWTYGGSTTADLPGEVLVGLAVSSNTEQQLGRGNFDDFLFCAGDAGAIDPPTVPPEDKPPGLKECVQTIKLGNFEASVITPPWQRNVDAYHASDRKHSGNFSLEFRASVGPRPEYKHLRPWAYQAVDVPGDVLPDTTGTLSFWQLVVPDSEEGRPDPSDRFYLAIRDSAGVTQTTSIPLAQGDTNTPVFQQKVISVETHLEGDRFAGFAAQEMQVAFYGVHNGQPPGTSFYIDDVRFDICTTQPIPEDVPGTASMGGLVEVLLRARPTKMPGIEVWAFARGGDLFRTKTIHDSTYHFYNVPPGIYTIYAEVWMEGILYTSTKEIEVVANERNYAINMLLQ